MDMSQREEYTGKHVKQILIVRKDLKMRQGKSCAQCAHAAIMFLCDAIKEDSDNHSLPVQKLFNPDLVDKRYYNGWLTEEQHVWLTHCFRKVTLYVNSLEELNEVCDKARAAGLTVNIMEDNGETEFRGVKTTTVAAIGPHWSEKFTGITDHLPLL